MKASLLDSGLSTMGESSFLILLYFWLQEFQTSTAMVLSFRWCHEVNIFPIAIPRLTCNMVAYCLLSGTSPMTSSSTKPTIHTQHNSQSCIQELAPMVCRLPTNCLLLS